MSTTIRQQSAEFAAASATQLPPQAAEVFAAEQQRWREQGVPEGTVAAGDVLADFTLPDATGAPVSLSETLADGPAVVVFYRGGWCPYCNIALRAYQTELLPELDARGVRLVAISPQSPNQSLSTSEKAELSFTVLSDPGARVARRLGIAFQPAEHVLAAQRELGLDLTQVNADGSPDLPMPTVLIVDPDRTVRFADTRADYTARTEVADILDALSVDGGV
jgi:peroxiredoxin